MQLLKATRNLSVLLATAAFAAGVPAQQIVSAALKKAGSTQAGQLRPSDAPSLLIAGLSLTDRDVGTILQAIVLERPEWRRKRNHVRMVGVLRVRVQSIHKESHVEAGRSTTIWNSSVQIGAWFVINPDVKGGTILELADMTLDEWRVPDSFSA